MRSQSGSKPAAGGSERHTKTTSHSFAGGRDCFVGNSSRSKPWSLSLIALIPRPQPSSCTQKPAAWQ